MCRIGEDQGGDTIGDLSQHGPLRAIHVDHADQHNVAIGAKLAMLTANSRERLHIPEVEAVEMPQITILDVGQRLPAGLHRSPASLGAMQDSRKIELVRCQLAMQLSQKLSERNQAGRSSSAGGFRTTFSNVAAGVGAHGADPGQLLGEAASKRLFHIVKQLGQRAHRDNPRRDEHILLVSAALDQNLEQPSS